MLQNTVVLTIVNWDARCWILPISDIFRLILADITDILPFVRRSCAEIMCVILARFNKNVFVSIKLNNNEVYWSVQWSFVINYIIPPPPPQKDAVLTLTFHPKI